MERLKVKDIIALVGIMGATYLAILDTNFRVSYGQIIAGVIGGYFGLSIPKD